MKTLLDGKESHDIFHDVACLNETLGEPEKTVSLFEQVDKEAALEVQSKALAVVEDSRLSESIPAGENQEAQQVGARQAAPRPELKAQ